MAQAQRRIPTDQEIEIAFRRLEGSPWSTVLARMLCFGTRPHEAVLGTITPDGCFHVPPNTKTGERIVPPFDRRWLKRAQGPLPKLTARSNRDYGLRCYQAFKRKDVPFNPYCCRHRFIVMTEEQGIPPAIGAIWAGHSTRTRYAVYMKTLDVRRALKYAYENGYTLNKPNQSNKQHGSYAI